MERPIPPDGTRVAHKSRGGRVMGAVHDLNKARIASLQAALSSGAPAGIKAALQAHFAPDARIRLGHPFGTLTGPEALFDGLYAPLLHALPDMERVDFIAAAGPRWGAHLSADQKGDWMGLGGTIIGTFHAPWLGIPATHGPVHMRYQEYMRLEEGRITHMEALWDIPQVMMQAGAWPMAPSRGVEWRIPGPARGQEAGPRDPARAETAVQTVWDMLHDLKQGTAQTPERGLGGFWHPNALWYGPSGLGTARGHDGIATRIFKQFRDGLSENTRRLDEGVFFADGGIVAFTGWPSGTAVHSGAGFLGLAPTGRRITRRSLDFWTVEDGMIRECWVMVDLPDLYRQLGIDLFARMSAMIGREGAAPGTASGGTVSGKKEFAT